VRDDNDVTGHALQRIDRGHCGAIGIRARGRRPHAVDHGALAMAVGGSSHFRSPERRARMVMHRGVTRCLSSRPKLLVGCPRKGRCRLSAKHRSQHMPRKKKNGAPAEQPISKVAFVKSLPPETAVSDVVAKAKEAGIEISKNYVYLIRSQGGAKGGKAKRKGRPPGKTKITVA